MTVLEKISCDLFYYNQSIKDPFGRPLYHKSEWEKIDEFAREYWINLANQAVRSTFEAFELLKFEVVKEEDSE
ncbi:hypothetical protein N9937_01845 [bacterium]|nr:hypothetical protein [bacterium]